MVTAGRTLTVSSDAVLGVTFVVFVDVVFAVIRALLADDGGIVLGSLGEIFVVGNTVVLVVKLVALVDDSDVDLGVLVVISISEVDGAVVRGVIFIVNGFVVLGEIVVV